MTSAVADRIASSGWSSQLSGTGLAIRRILRADRWFWVTWVLILWSFIPATASAYRSTISDDAAGREVAAALAANPTMRAMLGPPFDLLTVGGFTMFRVGGFTAMMAAIMGVLGVIRATRAEEEFGRTELLRAGSIGRHAMLAGALAVAGSASLLLGILVAISMVVVGTPVGGALVMGGGLALTPIAFAGVGACAAQVTASARTAREIGLAVVGAAYLLRALADAAYADSPVRTLRWLSPLEWAPLARPYAGNRWWVLPLLVALAAALVGGAFAMEARRDYGAGMRAARPGPAHAPAGLSSAGGLAWRLARGSVWAWTAGLAVFALAMGSMSGVFDAIADEPSLVERFRRMGAGAQDLTDAFYVAMLGILAGVIAIFALQLAERLRREEAAHRDEVMLATATSRIRYAAGHLALALIVPTLLLALVGALLALPAALRDGDWGELTRTVGAALVLSPAVWLGVGIFAAAFGWVPRLHLLPWLVVGWTLIVSWIGAVLGFPQRILDATPLAVLPQVPAESMSWPPVLIEGALALLLVVAGLAGYARRDIG